MILIRALHSQAAKLTVIASHARDLQGYFLHGGLIRDCLSFAASLEAKHLGEISELTSAMDELQSVV